MTFRIWTGRMKFALEMVLLQTLHRCSWMRVLGLAVARQLIPFPVQQATTRPCCLALAGKIMLAALLVFFARWDKYWARSIAGRKNKETKQGL